MVYSALQLKQELLSHLCIGYDPMSIARWAYEIYLDKASNIEPEAEKILMQLIAMEEGDEFVITEEELRKIASGNQET